MKEILAAQSNTDQLSAQGAWVGSIVGDLPQPICGFAPDGTIRYANQAFARLFGRSVEELAESDYFALWPETLREGMREQFVSLTTPDAQRSAQTSLGESIGPGVSARGFEWTAKARFDDRGEAVEFVCIGHESDKREPAEERTWPQESRLRALLEAIPDMVFVIRQDGTIVDFVPGHGLKTQRPPEELIQKKVADLLPPKIAEEGMRCLRQAFLTGILQRMEYETTVNGKIRHSEARLIPSESDEVICMVRNITDRKKDEARLNLRGAILENMSGGVGLVRVSDNTIVYANPTYEKMFGYAAGEMKGMHVSALNAPTGKTPRQTGAAIIASLKAEGVWRGEILNIRKDGETFWTYNTFSRFDHPKHGEVWVGVKTDISERKKALEELRESETRFRALVEKIPGIIYSTNGRRTEYISPQVETLLGFTPEECITIEGLWRRQLHPGDRERVIAANESHLKSERYDIEYRFIGSDGRTHWFHDRAVAVERDESGALKRFYGMMIDITEQKNSDEERQRLAGRIQQTQKIESLAVLAEGVAQDFNDLLTVILGNANLAMKSLSPTAPGREEIDAICEASRRAAGLCKQMLAYSGHGQLAVKSINLSEMIQDMSHLLEASTSNKAVLRFNLAPHLPPTEADVVQLRQLVLALAANASEAVDEESGFITISTGAVECSRDMLRETVIDDSLQEGVYVYVEVADSGRGMAPDVVSKIFDPFFTTKFTGRGLGLAAALGIARGHWGAMQVRSAPGKGSTFRALLPASDLPIESVSSLDTNGAEWKNRGAILVIDDEGTVRATARKMLEQAGLRVLTAEHGVQGLKIFAAHGAEIAAIVLDLAMPYMDGAQTLREIHALNPKALVILSSGRVEQDVRDELRGESIAGYLQKPYLADGLIEIIRNVLQD